MSPDRKKATDLFQRDAAARRLQQAPCAHRMRPRTLDEFVGQDHIIGPGRLLRRSIEADQLSSLILYGPPGTGKTTLASVIAHSSRSHFAVMNAVLAGVAALRQEIAAAEERFALHRQRTTLFVDEVHRWNKAQQDALLPHVETGAIIFIGATTENPFFEVIKPLVSRSRVFQLKPLSDEDITTLLLRALEDGERGFGQRAVALEATAREHLVRMANGDARSALNALELAVMTTPPDEAGVIRLDLAIAEESIQRRAVLYDKEGDAHYDAISAFIKSVRGSDPDAALYWGAKMIYAGEDPAFLLRRMAILASEDVGLADPQAIAVVDSCWSAYERIGMPEGMYPLAQAILYLATAPKSNSAMGLFEALQAVETEKDAAAPTHLKDGSRDAQAFGHGQGYKYPHAFAEHWVAQRYLPAGLEGKVFYEPGALGYEGQLRPGLLRRREEQLAAEPGEGPFDGENVSYAPVNRTREHWLARAGQASNRSLGALREEIFARAKLKRHHRVLVLNADNGLLLWEACRRTPEGGVWGLASPTRCDALRRQAARLEAMERPRLIQALDEVGPDVRFEAWIGLNPCREWEETRRWLACLAPRLTAEATGVCGQHLPQSGPRVYDLVPMEDWGGLRERLRVAEEALWSQQAGAGRPWDVDRLRAVMEAAGFAAEIQVQRTQDERYLERRRVRAWFAPDSPLGARLRAAGVSERDVARVADRYERRLGNRTVAWPRSYALIRLRRG